MRGNGNILAHRLQIISGRARGLHSTKLTALLITLAILLGALFLTPAISSLTSRVAIRSSGTIATTLPLHAEGRYIKNSLNQTVILRGVNKVGFEDNPGGVWMGRSVMDISQWRPEDVAAELDAIRSWGINVIRTHVAVDYWKYNTGNMRAMYRDFLQMAADRGIYVIFDGFQVINWRDGGRQDAMPFPPYQYMPEAEEVIANVGEFVDWWRSVASELKSYPNVIFELWNEPTWIAGVPEAEAFEDWLEASQLCIDAIREEGSDQLIVFQWQMSVWCNLYLDEEGNTYAQYGRPLSAWLETAIEHLNDPANNVVYSTHFYRAYGGTGLFVREQDQEITGSYRGYSEEHINAAFEYLGFNWVGEELNKPLLIGEYGANTWITTDPELTYETMMWDAVHKYMNTHDLQYIAFWWRETGQFRLHNGAPNFTPYDPYGEMLNEALKSGK